MKNNIGEEYNVEYLTASISIWQILNHFKYLLVSQNNNYVLFKNSQHEVILFISKVHGEADYYIIPSDYLKPLNKTSFLIFLVKSINHFSIKKIVEDIQNESSVIENLYLKEPTNYQKVLGHYFSLYPISATHEAINSNEFNFKSIPKVLLENKIFSNKEQNQLLIPLHYKKELVDFIELNHVTFNYKTGNKFGIWNSTLNSDNKKMLITGSPITLLNCVSKNLLDEYFLILANIDIPNGLIHKLYNLYNERQFLKLYIINDIKPTACYFNIKIICSICNLFSKGKVYEVLSNNIYSEASINITQSKNNYNALIETKFISSLQNSIRKSNLDFDRLVKKSITLDMFYSYETEIIKNDEMITQIITFPLLTDHTKNIIQALIGAVDLDFIELIDISDV